MVSSQLYSSALIHRSLDLQIPSSLDANTELGPTPNAANDQETSQGTHQATGEEEYEDASDPQTANSIS